jgi:hypothetical protein
MYALLTCGTVWGLCYQFYQQEDMEETAHAGPTARLSAPARVLKYYTTMYVLSHVLSCWAYLCSLCSRLLLSPGACVPLSRSAILAQWQAPVCSNACSL